jgi:hypothetical protein
MTDPADIKWRAKFRKVTEGPVFWFDVWWTCGHGDVPYLAHFIERNNKWFVSGPNYIPQTIGGDVWKAAVEVCKPLVDEWHAKLLRDRTAKEASK